MILTPTGGDTSVRRRNGDQPRDHAQSSQFDIPTDDKTCDDTESNNTAWTAADVETAAALESTEVTTMGAETQSMRMKLAFGVIVRLFLPLINGMSKRWQGIRSIKLLPRTYHANRSLFTNLFAHAANTLSMSLSSVHVHRIDPWLRKIKFRRQNAENSKQQPSIKDLPYPPQLRLRSTAHHSQDGVPEKSVTLNVLYEPPKNVPIRADIIFIHGLHGSLVNTWKQGLWNSEGRQEKFNRPPRPPVRPPKRTRHSRGLDAPHQFKRPRHISTSSKFNTPIGSPEVERFSSEQGPLDAEIGPSREQISERRISRDMSYYDDEPEIKETIDELEYRFPTFRTMIPEEHDYGHSWLPSVEGNTTGKRSGKSRNGKIPVDYSPCWPRDWLSKRFPDARVIALNYTTDPYLWRPLWIKKRNRTSLAERAREMTAMLIEKEVGVGHPIVWVGHSKGGIFIKQIIVDAWESGRLSAEPLWKSSRGTFFYSVPHRGSPLADFNLPLLRQSVELLEIRKNCPSILDLHRRFVALYHKGHLKVNVFSFVETALTLMSVLYLRIVGVDSADPGIGAVCGVRLDHREICKPRSETCMLYLELVKMIEGVKL